MAALTLPIAPAAGYPLCYLLHFDRPYCHARHYLGWTGYDLEQRLEHHVTGRGARLMQVITAAGIGFQVARVWPGATRAFERRLKGYGSAARLCPLCHPHALRRAAVKSAQRSCGADSSQPSRFVRHLP
jgi:hypothetical protein